MMTQDSKKATTVSACPNPRSPFSQELHRTLAFYLVILAWTQGADRIIIHRQHITTFLKINRLETIRVDCFRKDAAPWFPYAEPIYQDSSLERLLLSRVQYSIGSTIAPRVYTLPLDTPMDLAMIKTTLGSYANGTDAPLNSEKIKIVRKKSLPRRASNQ